MGGRRASWTIVIAETGTGHALLRGAQRRGGAARSTPRLAPKTATNDTAMATVHRASPHARGTDRVRVVKVHSRLQLVGR